MMLSMFRQRHCRRLIAAAILFSPFSLILLMPI